MMSNFPRSLCNFVLNILCDAEEKGFKNNTYTVRFGNILDSKNCPMKRHKFCSVGSVVSEQIAQLSQHAFIIIIHIHYVEQSHYLCPLVAQNDSPYGSNQHNLFLH